MVGSQIIQDSRMACGYVMCLCVPEPDADRRGCEWRAPLCTQSNSHIETVDFCEILNGNYTFFARPLTANFQLQAEHCYQLRYSALLCKII